MLFIFGVSVLITLFLKSTCADTTINTTSNAMHTTDTYFKETDVPENFLMSLERINLRKLSAISHYARQNQEVANSTTSRRCTCIMGVCKCCTGYVMDLFRQKACIKVTYHPGDFAFDVAMSMNNRILYENSLSGKNPRPICISPPRIPNLKVCAKFYNVFFPGRNFHFCLAMTGSWRSNELFHFAFDCLRMGAAGVAMVKPDEGGGLPIANPLGGVDAVVDAGEDDIEEYDENVVRSLLSDLFEDDDDYDDDDDDED